MDAGRYSDAVPYLKKLMEDWPKEYRFAIQLVTCRQALERFTEARAVLEDLFQRKARDAAFARKQLEDLRKKHQDKNFESLSRKEQQEIRKLQSQAEFSPYTMEFLMGSLLFSEGHKERALQHLKKAEKIESAHPRLYTKIGEIYLKTRDWNKAEQSFKRALSIDPDNSSAHLGLSRAYPAAKTTG